MYRLLTFLLCLSFYSLTSQQCGVDYIPIKPVPKGYKHSQSLKATVPALNLRLIAVQDENGQGGLGDSDLNAIETEIKTAFNGVATFNFCRIFPRDGGLLDCPQADNPYVHANAINMLVVPEGGCHSVSGMAGGNKGWASIELSIGTVVHELGHCFGLSHTHQVRRIPNGPGCLEDDNGDCITIKENVERDKTNTETFEYPEATNANLDPFPCYNCETEGDGICDTPADRASIPPSELEIFSLCSGELSVFDHCDQQLIDEIDDNGVILTDILRTNYMSYFNEDCYSTFTGGQKAKMSFTIDSEHQDRLVGSEPQFMATEITTGGDYLGFTGNKYVILKDITFNSTLFTHQLLGGQSLGIAPGVTLTFEDGGQFKPLESEIELYDGPFPLCHDGPMSGSSWQGVVVNSGSHAFPWHTTIRDVNLPIKCTDCDGIISLHSAYEDYTANAISADNAKNIVGILNSTFSDGSSGLAHIDVMNSTRFQFSNSIINGSGAETGILLANTDAIAIN